MSHKIKAINGVNINVEEIGTGKPIVFIHGWPVNHNMFEYQFTELPKHGYRCIGIDLRGFGDSDKPWEGYNYDTMADDVKAVLNFQPSECNSGRLLDGWANLCSLYVSSSWGTCRRKLALLSADRTMFY